MKLLTDLLGGLLAEIVKQIFSFFQKPKVSEVIDVKRQLPSFEIRPGAQGDDDLLDAGRTSGLGMRNK